MTLRIADSFTAALGKLSAQEQGAVKQTAFDLHGGLERPGLSLHRVDGARDKGFWTARVNDDIRIVLHRRGEDVLLAYVGHHDDAYRWAERRRFEVHPSTGAAQLVEIRETVQEVVVPVYVAQEQAKPKLFADTSAEMLLRCGVPEDWTDDVRDVDEDTVFALSDYLPAEVVEALIDLASGIEPAPPPPADDPFTHPDALRHFKLLTDEEDLRRALDAPWEAWAIFLHPAQREFVDRDFAGPARVIGSAGTGKTVVALHRAVRLARENPQATVLLTTFNALLATSLQTKLRALVGGDPDIVARITVVDLPSATRVLHGRLIGPVKIASDADIVRALSMAAEASDLGVDERFLADEWRLIVDGRQVSDRETYRNLPRLGRKRRLAGEKRETLWGVFEAARAALEAEGLTTYPTMLDRLSRRLDETGEVPFDFVVVDEAQDVLAAELRILGKMAGQRPNGLFFAGDIGQRIFRPAFSWRSEGVDIQGRSRSLRVNYRTSQQIRQHADGLLPATLVEADGSEDNRLGVQSLFAGPQPRVETFRTANEECAAVASWLGERVAEGLEPASIAVVVRSEGLLERASAAVRAAGLSAATVSNPQDAVRIAPMHDVKGLEFRAVAVIACDEGALPSEERLMEVADEASLSEVYATERHLLYVACTRARERLLVTGVEPASEFLEDFTRLRSM